MGLLDGKVALVTGAGGGLGRAHALLLAREGAKVVVNDFGGSLDGAGAGSPTADAVVAEIIAAGGHAVADGGSVSETAHAEAMVQRAIDAFGRLDIVVNNAGILRDKSLLKLDDAAFDAVIAVHARGTFLVTRAAVKVMSERGTGGSIISTTSIAGLKGNFGQTNYACAKAGIAGMTFTWAQELRRFKIRANAIAPIAKTRMTETIAAVPDDITPDQISPMVLFLASDLSEGVNGRIFGCHGKHLFEYHVETSPGLERAEGWTAATIAEKLGEISALAGPKVVPAPTDAKPASAGGSKAVDAVFDVMPSLFLPDRAAGWATIVAFEVGGVGAYGLTITDTGASSSKGKPAGAKCTITYDSEATFLGVLSGKLDASQAFMNGKIKTDNMGDLMKFARCFDMKKGAALMSGSAPVAPVADGLNREVIGKKYRSPAELMRPDFGLAYAAATNDPSPSYSGEGAVTPPLLSVRQLWTVAKQVVLDPEARVDMLHLVHGEQDMVFHQPIRPWDLIAARAEIIGIEDKASGQILSVRQRLMRDGDAVVEATSAYFIKGKPTGEKPAAAPKAPPAPPPEREWLFQSTFTVDSDQSYRYAAASLDDNPIHIDETTAKGAGFPSVILHGLATMAMTGREVINHVAQGDSTRLRRYKVRFARPVLPGDTLTVRSFAISKTPISPTQSILSVGVETLNQRGEIVIAAGLLEFTA